MPLNNSVCLSPDQVVSMRADYVPIFQYDYQPSLHRWDLALTQVVGPVDSIITINPGGIQTSATYFS
jgi:hypothetical protein